MGHVDDGLRDPVDVDDPIRVGSGKSVRAIKKGSLPTMLTQTDGNTVDVALKDYKYSPEFNVCLFSPMKAIETGWILSNQGTKIISTKQGITITFDRITKTKDGVLCGVEMVPRIGEDRYGEDPEGSTMGRSI